MGLFDSVSYVALHSALDGLALRQRAIADNVANINTPGYTARRVSFEQALSTAVSNGSGAVAPTESRSLEPTRTDGNNVNLELVKGGWAWRYPQYDKPGDYIQAEQEARDNKRGLLADKDPTAPWD